MTAGELLTGQQFRLPGKTRRYLKVRDYGEQCHILTKQNQVQHDEKGNPAFVPHITARTMSGRKFDLPKHTPVEPL